MYISPDWPAPVSVRALMTTRQGGVSHAPFDSMNLGYSTADPAENVVANEARLAAELKVDAAALRWVRQVHGSVVKHAELLPFNAPLGATSVEADAIVSRTRGLFCGIKIADCMPVLMTSKSGDVVAAAHAGWRGLAGGIVENTLAEMQVSPGAVIAWLGPCIGAQQFEVGNDVRDEFFAATTAQTQLVVQQAFTPLATHGKFLCDLRAIAKAKLNAAGVNEIYISYECTMSDQIRFFSHRRDKITGRMAAVVGIA